MPSIESSITGLTLSGQVAIAYLQCTLHVDHVTQVSCVTICLHARLAPSSSAEACVHLYATSAQTIHVLERRSKALNCPTSYPALVPTRSLCVQESQIEIAANDLAGIRSASC